MVEDPLYNLLTQTLGFQWWSLWISYAVLFISLVLFILYFSGGKERVKNYTKDTLGAFLWPFLVLGPISGAYINIAQLGEEISSQIELLGKKYQDFQYFRLDNYEFIFWVALIIAFIEGIDGQIRYSRHRSNLWLSKPKFLHPLLMILFNIPMTIMALLTVVRVLDQWGVLHNFMHSGWMPNEPFNKDGMYGIKWLYTIIISQISIAVFVSFGSIIMLVREGKQKYAWIYKALFFVLMLVVTIALITLTVDLNTILKDTYSNFYIFYASVLNESLLDGRLLSDGELLKQILVEIKINKLHELPQSMPIPDWLNSLLGIRLVILIPEIYQLIAKKFGWKNIPEKIIKFAKEVT